MAYLILRRDPDANPIEAAPPQSSLGRMLPFLGVVFLALTVAWTIQTSGFGVDKYGRQTTWSPYYRIDYRQGATLHRHEPDQPAGDGAAQ